MREGWALTQLGEILRPVRRMVVVSDLKEVPFIGVRWYVKGAYHTKTVDSSAVKTKKLNVVREGDVIYYKEWATKGSFAVAGRDVDGCMATSLFPVFTVDTTRVLTQYLEMAFRSADFLQEAADRAVGTTERRALKEPDFLSIEILLPPREEQQRIVDLIGSLDDTIEAADDAAEAARAATDELRRDLLTPREDSETATLKEVAKWGSGKFVAKENRVADGRYPILGANGEIGRTDSFLYDEDLITVGRVGACGEVHRCSGKSWVSDNALVARPSTEDFEYIYQAVQSVDYSSLISGTSQPLITQTALLAVQIAWPSPEERRRIAAMLSDSSEATCASAEYASSLRATRSELLTVLLSGEHEIPESYDIDTAVQLEPAA